MDVLLHSPIIEVVGALLAGGLGLPIPEELVLMSAGWCIARGSVEGTAMIACALAAMVAGDLILYMAGRCGLALGFARRDTVVRRLAQLERAFERHGVKLIVVGRFVPGLRGALLVAAGAARMPPWRLVACDAIAAVVGGLGWIALGRRVGPHLARARELVGATHLLVVVAAVLVVVVAVAARRQRDAQRDAQRG